MSTRPFQSCLLLFHRIMSQLPFLALPTCMPSEPPRRLFSTGQSGLLSPLPALPAPRLSRVSGKRASEPAWGGYGNGSGLLVVGKKRCNGCKLAKIGRAFTAVEAYGTGQSRVTISCTTESVPNWLVNRPGAVPVTGGRVQCHVHGVVSLNGRYGCSACMTLYITWMYRY